MSQRSLVRIGDSSGEQKRPDPPKPSGRFFDFFFFPLGSSFIFIAIIGSPRSLYKLRKYAAGLTRHLKTGYLESNSKKKIDSGAAVKGLLIPFLYSGIEGILSATRGVDDHMNILTAGTLTGALFRAMSGNLRSLGTGGLYGLGLSSLYCLWKGEEFNDKCQDEPLERNYDDTWDE